MKAELVYHDKVVEPDHSIIEIKIWSVPKSSDKPHSFKYSLVYIRDGKRVVGSMITPRARETTGI